MQVITNKKKFFFNCVKNQSISRSLQLDVSFIGTKIDGITAVKSYFNFRQFRIKIQRLNHANSTKNYNLSGGE